PAWRPENPRSLAAGGLRGESPVRRRDERCFARPGAGAPGPLVGARRKAAAIAVRVGRVVSERGLGAVRGPLVVGVGDGRVGAALDLIDAREAVLVVILAEVSLRDADVGDLALDGDRAALSFVGDDAHLIAKADDLRERVGSWRGSLTMNGRDDDATREGG